MVQSFLKGYKTLWEKEKLLIVSNFSFSHSVFKILVLQTRKKPGLNWERVKVQQAPGFYMSAVQVI